MDHFMTSLCLYAYVCVCVSMHACVRVCPVIMSVSDSRHAGVFMNYVHRLVQVILWLLSKVAKTFNIVCMTI